jgi:hypothetical protein
MDVETVVADISQVSFVEDERKLKCEVLVWRLSDKGTTG